MMPKISGVHFLWVGIFIGGLVPRTASAHSNEFPSGLVFASQSTAHFKFEGFTGRRIDAMVENWLLRVPGANPGMLEMFRVRDREPKPKLVPWAGEFVGKYLISAIQAQRLTANSELDRTVPG